MKKALILILICTNAYSQISSKRINRWVAKNEILKNSVVSIAVKELDKNKKINGININTFMTPASNLKILIVLGSIHFGDTIPVIKYNLSNDTLKISPTGYPLLAHPKYQNKEFENDDIKILTNFLSEQGKILPRRVTGLTSKEQKKVAKLIKTARIAALLPFVIGKG